MYVCVYIVYMYICIYIHIIYIYIYTVRIHIYIYIYLWKGVRGATPSSEMNGLGVSPRSWNVLYLTCVVHTPTKQPCMYACVCARMHACMI